MSNARLPRPSLGLPVSFGGIQEVDPKRRTDPRRALASWFRFDLRMRHTILTCTLIAALFFPLHPIHAEKISIRLQLGDRTVSISGYDSSGVVYVSVREYASALSLPYFENREWKKAEIRLRDHRVKLAALNPFVSITNTSDGTSSAYQFPEEILFIDSAYYAPVTQFLALVERLSPSGVSFNVESRVLVKQPLRGATKYDITGISVETRTNGYLLTIKASRKLGDYDAILKTDGWLIVRIVDALADTAALRQFKPGEAIKQLLVIPSPTSVQLTFRVSPDISEVDPLVDEQTNDLLLSLHTRTADKVRDKLEERRTASKLDLIVIDAGHGGKDPGTIGVAGTREKDITLGVALKLGSLIEKNLRDVKVVYTRKTDTFVELDRRAQIANEAGGKLFISIHCNSTERKPSSANGFEIYILRPGKTASAIRIAEVENSPIQLEEGYKDRYQELTEENFILVTMRQSAFMRYSEQFAEQASEAMANLLKIQNSGVKQAGFYVLVGASMPNVLVETGYLSNRQEERVLRNERGQKKIAEALLEGIKGFRDAYEKELQESRPQDRQGS